MGLKKYKYLFNQQKSLHLCQLRKIKKNKKI